MAEGRGVGGIGETGGRDSEVQTSSGKISYKDEDYSIGNIVNDSVTNLYGDRW